MQLIVARGFTPELASYLTARNIGGATFDCDKVLTEYDGTQAYPDAIRFVGQLATAGVQSFMATNTTNTDRLPVISQQFQAVGGMHIRHRLMSGMAAKPHPAMLLSAKRICNVGCSMVHFDDQLKGGVAAARADFQYFVWMRPNGRLYHDHPGTLALRGIELPIFAGMLLLGTLLQSERIFL